MNKGLKLRSLAAVLLSVFLLASCSGDEVTSQTPSTPEESVTESSQNDAPEGGNADASKESGSALEMSGELYDSELFTVVDGSATFKLGMTISDLEAQGLDVTSSRDYETENLLIFFDDNGVIDDILAFEGVEFSGDFTFDLDKDGILALFNVDEANEDLGNKQNVLMIYFLDKGNGQYERAIATQPVKESAPTYNGQALLLLEIDLNDDLSMFCFNLYYPM